METHRTYGWHHARQQCSHGYLLPYVTQQLKKILPGRPGRIVDLGCGNGAVTAELAQLGHDVVGVDVSADGIELAKQAFPTLRFEVGSVYDSQLEESIGSAADVVVSLEVLEHLFHPRELFRQSARLLRPGGTLILSTPYHGYWKNLALAVAGAWDRHLTVGWDGGHIKFFSMKTAAAMARECGFEVVELAGVGRLPYLWMSMFLVARKP